jgi:hypothetical protein
MASATAMATAAGRTLCDREGSPQTVLLFRKMLKICNEEPGWQTDVNNLVVDTAHSHVDTRSYAHAHSHLVQEPIASI